MTKQDIINAQQAEIDTLRAMLETYRDGVESLRRYLTSEKFYADPTVQTMDVLDRLGEVRSAVIDAEFEGRGVASAVRKARYRNAMEPDQTRTVRWADFRDRGVDMWAA